MKATFKIDTSQLEKAIFEVEKETGRDVLVSLNRAMKNAAFRAWQFTVKADGTKIAKWATEPLIYRLVAKRRREKGEGAIDNHTMQMEVAKAIRRLWGSRGYIRTGWAKAVRDFGGSIRGSRPNVSNAGLARFGYGKKGTASNLTAIIVNTATGAEKISGPPLQKAIDYIAAVDLPQYIAKKLGKTFKAHSAR